MGVGETVGTNAWWQRNESKFGALLAAPTARGQQARPGGNEAGKAGRARLPSSFQQYNREPLRV